MKAGKNIYWAGGVIAVLVLVIWFLNPAGTEVETVKIGNGGIQRTVADTGYVQSSSAFDLYSDQGGTIKNIAVNIGQEVEKDQVIMSLANTNVSVQANQAWLQLSQANAVFSAGTASVVSSKLNLDKATEDLGRVKKLLEAGAVSQTEYDTSRLTLEKYQQTYQQQIQNLNAAREQVKINEQLFNNLAEEQQGLMIKSPVNGTITQLPVKQEQYVLPGTMLVKVAQTSQLEIKADILSDDLAEVKPGQKVEVSAPVLGGKVLTGTVAEIYPEAEEKQSALGVVQRRVPVIIALNEAYNLKPGYETQISIMTLSKDQIILVPRESVLTTSDNRRKVMVVTNGRIQHRYIQTGLSDSMNYEVVKGLKAGDQIVKDGNLDLKENSRVKIL